MAKTRQQLVRVCTHCGQPFYITSPGEFRNHVRRCRGNTPPKPYRWHNKRRKKGGKPV